MSAAEATGATSPSAKPAADLPATSEPANGAASPEIKQESAEPSAQPSATSPTPAAASQPAAPSASSAANAPGTGNAVSLYVGELDPTVTEAMLYEIFSMIGPVSSIRVCRDAVTRRSLGYAYVNYLNAPDAERALDSLNYSLIKNKACRIMQSQRDPALRRTGAGNIFLKNLDETIDNKALHDTFAAFGNILSCKVQLDENGISKGYGFVHFETGEAGDAAIEGVNGMLLNDKVVYVGHHVPKRERQAKIDEVRSHFTNLYVKNLHVDVAEPEFREMFEKYGKVTSAVVSVDTDGKSRGFGFVNFENHEDARKAVDDLHDKEFKGQTLFVTRAQKKSEREEELRKSYEQAKYEKTVKYQGVNLYVKNLDDDMDDEKLNSEFQPFGSITSCKIMRDEKGASKGFGFVCFSAPDEATKAVTELNGKMLGSKPLYVSLAQPKDIRQQQLAAQVAQREQIRSQQLAASGIPQMAAGNYMQPGQPMYYPGAPGGYPAPAGRGMPQMNMRGYPQPMQGRFPGQMPNMPPMPYPQGYPAYPGGGRGGMPQQMQGMQQGRPPFPNGMAPNAGPMGGMPMRGQQQMPPQGRGPMPPAAAGARPPAGRPAARPEAGQASANGPSITAAALASAGPAEQKQMLGEALYPRIHETVPSLAGKITGMLLEMDNSELLHLLENDEALSGKVTEAIQVLEDFSAADANA